MNQIPVKTHPGLNRGECHVWQVDLDDFVAVEWGLVRLLSETESMRMSRFVLAEDRNRYAVGHSILRILLGRYLCKEPGSIAIESTVAGKPFVPSLLNQKDIRFNLAHSQECCLIALCQSHEVGVDLERIRPMGDALEIARRHFAPSEVAALEACQDHVQQEAFFRYWTCKEAFVKALGQGLSMPLSLFELELGPNGTASLKGSDSDRWRLFFFSLNRGFVGALAAEKPVHKVTHFRFRS